MLLWFAPPIAKKKKSTGRRYVPKSVSISPEMEAEIAQRMQEMGIENFSRYIQDLVRKDLEKQRRNSASSPSKSGEKTKATTKKK